MLNSYNNPECAGSKNCRVVGCGTKLVYGHLTCVVLEDFEDSLLVLSKDSIGEMPFDAKGYNNFDISSLREYLNDGFIEELKENGADVTALCDFTIDLTSDDGLKDYGNSTNKVNLLTCDMYRKYRYLIPNLDNWWWLATADSTKSNGYSNAVRNVRTDGTLSYGDACYGSAGVRPALTLKSDIFLSTESELGKYTATELLEELMRRNHAETL
jgi:hypothetical protein